MDAGGERNGNAGGGLRITSRPRQGEAGGKSAGAPGRLSGCGPAGVRRFPGAVRARGFVSFLLAAALVGLMLAAAYSVEQVNRERDFSDAIAGERVFGLLDGGRSALASSGWHALEQVDIGTIGTADANRPVWENAVAMADAYGKAGSGAGGSGSPAGAGSGAGSGGLSGAGSAGAVSDAEIVFWCASECPLAASGYRGGLRERNAAGASVPPGAWQLDDARCQDYFWVSVEVQDLLLYNGSRENVTLKTLEFGNATTGVVGVSAWDARSGWLADSCVSREIELYGE